MMGFVSLDFPYFPTLMVTASSPTHSSAAYRCIDRLLQLSLPAQLDFLGPLMPSISTHGSHMVRGAFCNSEAPLAISAVVCYPEALFLTA